MFLGDQSRWGRVLLGALQAFIGLGGLYGGLMLVLDPTGSTLGMTVAVLARSPFPDFLVPGLALLAVIGVGHLVGAVATFASWRRAGDLAIGLGLFLASWIGIQALWIGLSSPFQAPFFALGLLEVLQGMLRSRFDRDASQRTSSAAGPD